LSGDEFKEDNLLYGLFQGPPLLKVLLVHPEQGNKEFCLTNALDPFASDGRKGKTPFLIRSVSRLGEVAHLSGYDLVILPDAGVLTDEEVFQIEEFLRSGGGLLAGFGLLSPLENYNRLWNRKDGALPVKLIQIKAPVQSAGLFLTKDGEHFFESLSDPLHWRSVFYSRIIKTSAEENSGANQVLIQNGEKDSFLMIRSLGKGFAAWFFTDLSPEGTSLVLEPVFVPLLHSLADFLTRAKRQKIYHSVGERILVETGGNPDSLTCFDPDMDKIKLQKKDAEHLYFCAGKPGVYQIMKEQEQPKRIVVNTPPEESRLKYIAKKDWQTLESKHLFIGDSNEDMDRFMKQHSGLLNLWRLLLWMVLLMLILEMGIVSRLRK
jgi:hypothetical protein